MPSLHPGHHVHTDHPPPQPPPPLTPQVVETEHLFKALLEQPNGLARRILSKAGSDPSSLLDKTDAFIRKQPRVSGSASQVRAVTPPPPWG
jgi:ATP-dependent Clp protease ATP-binding subunit ClpA